MPKPGEERDLEIGDWTVRVRILTTKDSAYKPHHKHVTMEVIG